MRGLLAILVVLASTGTAQESSVTVGEPLHVSIVKKEDPKTPATAEEITLLEPQLHCTPAVAMTGAGGRPVSVTCIVSVHQTSEQLWCPGVRWIVDNTPIATHERDCEAYEEAIHDEEGEEREPWIESRHLSLGPGEHLIEAQLFKAGKTLSKLGYRTRVVR